MDDSDKESLPDKKGGQHRMDVAEDTEEEPPAYDNGTKPLVLHVERDGSRRRVYKRQDTGEILYTTRNFNGLTGYHKYWYRAFVSSENEAPKSDDFTTCHSSSSFTLPYAVFDNTTMETIDPQSGARSTSQETRFHAKWYAS
jgi:hypothetical protein